jgi:O-antigen/teichoic acid export membrane protein
VRLDVRHSRFARLLDGVGGQLYSRGALILFQIVAIPLLISAWGVERYGAWLALTALAGFAANANFGVLNAFAVEISSIGTDGAPDRLRTTAHTATIMLCLLLAPVLLLMCAAGWFLPVASWLKLEGVTRLDVFQILLLVSAQIWADNLRSVSSAIIVARGRYGLPNLLAGTFRLLEIAGLALVVLLLDGTIVHAAALATALAVLSLAAHRAVARAMTDGALRGDRRFDSALVRELLPASIGNFILSFGVNTLAVHGTRVALSAFLGPLAVAAFAVTMTAVKTIDQINAAFIAVLQPEFSRLRGAGSPAESERLLAIGSQTALVSFLLLAAGLLAVGPWVFDLWTAGAIAFSYRLAALLLVGVMLMQVAKTAQYFLIGNNAVLGFGMGSLAGCAIGLGVSIATMPYWGIYGAAIGFSTGELLVLATSLGCAASQLGIPPLRLLGRLVSLAELPATLTPIVKRNLRR